MALTKIGTDGFKDDAVTGAKIVDDAVGAEHIEQLDADLSFADSAKAKFGAGNDLEIYHDGSGSAILNAVGSGQLTISSDNALNLTSRTGQEYFFRGYTNGAAELYHDNSKKLETISTGLNVTGGVRLGGNNAANELDDYEEGSWTPDLRFGGATTGITYATDDPRGGKYVKIGRQVTLNYSLSLASKGSANGDAKIFGLPFTVADDFTGVNTQASGIVGFFNNLLTDSSLVMNCADDSDNSLRLRHTVGPEDDPDSMNDSHFGDNADLRGSITYFTDQ